MLTIKTVLCPVDFSDLTKREIQIAVEVCQSFGAHLVIHHNMSAVSAGLTRAWEWQEVHRMDTGSMKRAEEQMRSIMAEIPKTVTSEASITTGPVGTILLQLAEKLPGALLILGSHGWSTHDHSSVTERVIERCPVPVLTLHDTSEAAPRFRLRAAQGEQEVRVVVPTDFSDSGQKAVDYAFDLARAVPVELHLLNVVSSGEPPSASEAAEKRLDDLVPADLKGRVESHVVTGHAIDEILAFSQRSAAEFIVMGEHARGFFRRFFTKDTAREVLHRSPCPVWFIPPGA